VTDYLERILKARVYDVAVETPLDPAANLSARLGNRLLLKREDMQPVFSFKLRGAYNKMAHLPRQALRRGVICASAGTRTMIRRSSPVRAPSAWRSCAHTRSRSTPSLSQSAAAG
jgi:hypothetical protein